MGKIIDRVRRREAGRPALWGASYVGSAAYLAEQAQRNARMKAALLQFGRPIPSQMDIIRRSAAISGANAARVREDALMSGAMPGEFEVVHVYRSGIAYTGMEARLK